MIVSDNIKGYVEISRLLYVSPKIIVYHQTLNMLQMNIGKLQWHNYPTLATAVAKVVGIILCMRPGNERRR